MGSGFYRIKAQRVLINGKGFHSAWRERFLRGFPNFSDNRGIWLWLSRPYEWLTPIGNVTIVIRFHRGLSVMLQAPFLNLSNMTQKQKNAALKKVDIVLCKLQDLYYLGITNTLATSIGSTLDAVRLLGTKIEQAHIEKKAPIH